MMAVVPPQPLVVLLQLALSEGRCSFCCQQLAGKLFCFAIWRSYTDEQAKAWAKS